MTVTKPPVYDTTNMHLVGLKQFYKSIASPYAEAILLQITGTLNL